MIRPAKVSTSVVLLTAIGLWSAPAHAITIDITTKDPSLVGASFSFSATATDTSGPVQYRWSFGDDVKTDFTVGQSQIDHVYAAPGHYTVAVTVKDDVSFSGETLTHIVHYPVTEKRPTTSSSIIWDQARNRIYNVNQDNDTISSIDPMALTKVAELPVYPDPQALALAPDGKLWVVHRDSFSIAIVDPDAWQIVKGFRLPYASQPIGLCVSPGGDAIYVTLMGTGKLLKLDPATGDIVSELDVGPSARGVAVSADSSQILVTRFVSPLTGGEVVQVDAATMMVKNRYVLTPDTTTMDTDQRGRGLPNFLFSASYSPDGREAWVSGKKDDIFRGVARDGLKLTQDNTVRPMVSVLDLSQTTESQAARIDLDDRDLPTFTEFSPLGDYAFVTVTGSNLVEVRDAYTKGFVTALTDAGLTPRGTVLGPKNQLFVQGSMERSVVVYDVSTVLDSSDIRSIKVKDIPVVETEKLAPDVLLGKQVFSNSADGRMTIQGYLTCITCHFDGAEDGEVYDFTSRNEGFRNTISLKGHRGTGQGNLLWSGAFDEVQDFEAEIRDLFLGHGFIADDALAMGTRAQALGDKKAGLSKELDGVAAYLATLDHADPSPFKNPDGTMTADALAGKALFGRLGCDFCHAGKDFTDSARGRLHDVGTLKPTSGTRDGQPLTGLDTPSLLGVWETAPYLHDGSAPTLKDVLTTANPNDQHGFTSSLSAAEVDQLVAYLQQLDGDPKLPRLPFEPPEPEGGAGGAPSDTGGAPDLGGSGGGGGTAGVAGVVSAPSGQSGSCAVSLGQRTWSDALWLLLAPVAGLAWRRNRRKRGGAR